LARQDSANPFRRRIYRGGHTSSSDALWLARRLILRLLLIPLPVIAADQGVDFFFGSLARTQQVGECRISRIVDGDTVGLNCSGAGSIRGRLLGFDAPELFSPKCPSELVAAAQAKWALRGKLWNAHDIRIVPHGHDRYDRLLVAVYVDGQDISDAMIAGGYARPYDGGRRGGWC
jgi:micrococcal nuclease